MAVRTVAWPHDIVAVARSLAEADNWFWLDGESPEPDGKLGRSYLGATDRVLHAQRGEERAFLDRLRQGIGAEQSGRSWSHIEPDADTGALPEWVTAFSYEFGVALMGEEPAADDAPAAFALGVSTVLVLDHSNATAELRGSDDGIDDWLRQHGHALRKTRSKPQLHTTTPLAPHSSGHIWRASDSEYLCQIEACKRAIGDGEAYVLCLTDMAELPAPERDALRLYEALRREGTATRGAVIVAGNRALVSVSPERFLSVRGPHLSTHPIKGTRARGTTPEHDARLAAELAADPKERAENLMIVDLMRNDLSRVCKPATVATKKFLRVETHPRVHQLVSSVTGTLREGVDVFDTLEALFPGGSMTGAPKHRAVQLITELEGGPRGLYSGCFGWIGRDSAGVVSAELAMSIRCVELRDIGGVRPIARVGAGGGITHDSEAVAELAEKHLKASPLLAALRQTQSE